MKTSRFFTCLHLSFYVHFVQCHKSSSHNGLESSAFDNPYRWTYLNFTWRSYQDYTAHVDSGDYIPEHNIFTGIKMFEGTIYLTVPRYRAGVPVTLVRIPADAPATNPLLEPFPNWELSGLSDDCSTLQSVQSMEIDTKGIMWVIDGVRINNISTNCPPKLVLLDLKDGGKVVHVYNFPDDVSRRKDGFLNDIVVDEGPEGNFAYISESSSDPGLIIYSRKEDNAWKLRDKTMEREKSAENFTVNQDLVYGEFPINGIALSPFGKKKRDRYIYYSALGGFFLYKIPTSVAKNYELYKNDEFRSSIELVGRKQGQGDGMGCDHKGNLFYTVISESGIGEWDSNLSFEHSKMILRNETLLDWPDTMAFDNIGSIYVTSSRHIYELLNPEGKVQFDPETIEYNIIKIHTGTKSYLY